VDKENNNVIYISQKMKKKMYVRTNLFQTSGQKNLDDNGYIHNNDANIPLCVWAKKIHALYTYHIQKRNLDFRLANWSYLSLCKVMYITKS